MLERDADQARLLRPKSNFRKLEVLNLILHLFLQTFSGKPSSLATNIWHEYEFSGKQNIDAKDLKPFFRKSQIDDIMKVFDMVSVNTCRLKKFRTKTV